MISLEIRQQWDVRKRRPPGERVTVLHATRPSACGFADAGRHEACQGMEVGVQWSPSLLTPAGEMCQISLATFFSSTSVISERRPFGYALRMLRRLLPPLSTWVDDRTAADVPKTRLPTAYALGEDSRATSPRLRSIRFRQGERPFAPSSEASITAS